MGCCVSSPAAAAVVVEDAGKQTLPKVLKAQQEYSLDAFSSSTAETKNDALLALIPGRMSANGASNRACIFTQQGRKGTNQDAMLVWEGFAAMEDTVFCGVFDGHGPYGHLVARTVRDSLPSKIFHYWQQELHASRVEEETKVEAHRSQEHDQINSINAWMPKSMQNGLLQKQQQPQTSFPTAAERQGTPEDMVLVQGGGALRQQQVAVGDKQGSSQEPATFGAWKESHLTAYRVMDKELFSHQNVDCFCSGTTTVTVLKQGHHLVIANVGDSRAILATKDENGALKAVQLTVDLKPNLPKEAERIRQCKGRVFALHDEPEVPRVWLPFDDAPGLAMARAFGDFCLKDYGVIAVPELSYRQLTDRDQFIVLATDGIWDVLSNDEVVHIIASAPTRATAARALVESAVCVWRLKYPTSKVDDCAVVCLYLDHTVFSISAEHLKTEEEQSSSPQHQQSTHLNTEDKQSSPQHRQPTHVNQQPLNVHGAKKSRTLREVSEKEAARSSTLKNTHASAATASRDPQSSSASSATGEVPTGVEVTKNNNSKPHKQRSLAEWLVADEDKEWSALEGVTRVNSLLNLPRFSAKDKRLDVEAVPGSNPSLCKQLTHVVNPGIHSQQAQ